jgi:hypothetical protein
MSLEKLTKTKGEDHPDTLKMMNNTGAALGKLNRREESLVMLEKVLKKCARMFGENDPSTLLTMASVANQLSFLDRNDEALDLRKKVFEKRSRILGNEHPDTVRTLCNLAMAQINAVDLMRHTRMLPDVSLLLDRSATRRPLLAALKYCLY